MDFIALLERLSPLANLVLRYPIENHFRRPEKLSGIDELRELASTAASAPATSRREAIEQRGGGIAPFRTSDLATTEETVAELKRRLAKELYRFQLDLAAGCKIAGKPCDCCDKHPSLGLEAMCEELIPMDPTNPIYREIPEWYMSNAHKLTAEASVSGKYDAEFPLMAALMRDFRKRLLGTETLTAMVTPKPEITLEAAKAEAARLATQAIEQAWQSNQPRLIGPTEREREPAPEELEFFADSAEQIDESMNRNGLRKEVDAVFQEAIAQAKGSNAQ